MFKLSKNYAITQFALILCALGVFPGYMPAKAADKPNLPLDVVLVMDSSGSMKHTDPDELRKPAAKLLISLLGDNDRASVVSFSDQGYPVAFLTPVKGKPNETKLFAAVDRISNKGGYTNLLGAVEGAMRVIRRNPLPDRKTIIVLMTDGKMDLGDNAKNQSKSNTLIKDLIPQLKDKKIELHTIAFTDQSDKPYLEKLAQATGGKFNLAQTDKQLHDVYTSIFEQNKQPNMLPFDGEKFTVDNAIKEVTIVGAKDNEKVVLSLLTPGGEVIAAANKADSIKWFTAQAFDLITIQNPQSGQWQIKSSTGKNKAYIITDLKFQLEVEPQEVAIGDGIVIRAWLEEKGKTIAKPSILSTVKMGLRVHTPEGDTHELDMQAQPKEDGSGELSGAYMNHIALPADGRYKIEVVAEGGTFSRVRNSLVSVFDPNVVSETHPASAESQHESSPAMPDIKPVIDTELAAAAQEPPEVHSTPAEVPPQPEKTTPEEPRVVEAAASEHHQEQPIAEQKTEPVQDKVTPAHDKPVEKTNHGEVKDQPESAAKKDEPNLMKALGIFLLINGVFAVLGGAGFLIYNMRKKKAANANSDANSEEFDDEKKAA